VKLLALDTSSIACSVALQVDEGIVERHEIRPREHTRLLLPMIRELLGNTGIAAGELDAVVLGNGPGSFIGMRIAASVAQGIAYGAGLGVVAVSSLAAVAAEVLASDTASDVVVAQDARMDQVYLGFFSRGGNDLPAPWMPERLHGQGPIEELPRAAAAGIVAAGTAWERYPALLAANRDRIGRVADTRLPRARYLLGLGQAAISDGGMIDPGALSPAYLREKVARPASESP